MARPVHIFNMFNHLRAFVFLLASVTTVYCGDVLQKTHLDNGTLQHQSKRNSGSTQYELPFAGEIRHPMYDGKEIKVQGNILHKPNRLTVDLCGTRTCLIDIEFQVEYRFKIHRLSMNYKRNLQWGPAEIWVEKLLEEGKAVNMTIVIDSNQFKVLFDSTTFVLNVAVRMTKIKYIGIRGTATIDWILYSWNSPPQYFRFNPDLQDQKLIIVAYPTAASRFFFNFMHANETAQPSSCMPARIQLHFDSRFSHGGDTRKILLSYKNPSWGTQTYIPTHKFPYEVNVTFRNQVSLRRNQFQILVNQVASYNYNRSPDGVEIVCYHGSVVVQTIYTT